MTAAPIEPASRRLERADIAKVELERMAGAGRGVVEKLDGFDAQAQFLALDAGPHLDEDARTRLQQRAVSG